MTPLLFLLGGLVLLVSGAEWLVKGATRIALTARVPAGIIGLTLVAAGTSLPELFVSVSAALKGSPDVATGNVVGSNFYNIALILGAAAVIRPMPVTRETLVIEWPVLMVSGTVMLLMALNGTFGRVEGAVLLLAHIAYVASLMRRAHLGAVEPADDEPEHRFSVPWELGRCLLGLIGLTAGSQLLILGATELAQWLGFTERVIGLTVVSLGTSLPELATSVMAAWRGEEDIAVGNVVGSNVFNVLAILGTTAVITPIPVHPSMVSWDIPWMLGLTLLLLPIMITGRRVSRGEGVGLLGIATAYTALLIAS